MASGFMNGCKKLRLCAFSTFRCQGPGGTWRSTGGHLRRIDYVCGPSSLVDYPGDAWVARELGMATARDDNFPVVAELLWQPMPPCLPMAWHCPIMHRAACVEGEAALAIQHKLALVSPPPEGNPVDAYHAYVAGVLQSLGAELFSHSS